MSLTLTEKKMWEQTPLTTKAKKSYDLLGKKYWAEEQRILIEINRQKLPSFVVRVKKPGFMDLQPFELGRQRWDRKKQSRLIESFIINIPVPPIILYQQNYNSYQVMDGRQRITAIKDFYNNQFKLTGLEIWRDLEGHTYDNLPINVRADLDSHSLSSLAIMTESDADSEEALFLKQKAFERLHAHGLDLSNQEVRNCLYPGKFNSLLQELASNQIFVEAWKLPRKKHPKNIQENLFDQKMEDVELILRFFALRNVENFRGKMKEFLDTYMRKSRLFSEADIQFLGNHFLETIELASQLYEEHLFKPFNPVLDTWKKRPSPAYYDSVMVGLSQHFSEAGLLIERKSRVIEETKRLFKKDESRLLTGRGKTKTDIQKRIKLFDDMLSQVIGE